MFPSVSVSKLSWAAPDGTTLFTNLDLTFGPERTGIVGRNGTGKTTLLRLIAGDLRPALGQVRVSGTLAMMRQEVMEHPRGTVADLFGLKPALDLLDRVDAGSASVDDLAEADWTLPAQIEAALLRCDLPADPRTPLATLSGGQRGRAALAAMIYADPDILLLDEPTNNLDRAGRRLVIDLVRSRRGAAIVISHDRELLEEMDAIVELTTLAATRYGGNYSVYREQKDTELDAARRAVAHAEKTRAEAARRAQRAAERKARKDSAGRRARAKGDQPRIMMDAAKERAEASGGAGNRMRDTRREAADEGLATARDKVEVLQPVHLDIPKADLAPNKLVLRMDRVSGGYVADRPIIRDLSLTINGPERVVIAGHNGSGKTTLLKLASRQLRPQSGTVDLMVPFAMLDQHVGFLNSARSLRENFIYLKSFGRHPNGPCGTCPVWFPVGRCSAQG